MKNMWKVPFRQVYCATFVDMVRQTLWCHVVIRVFPFARDLRSDSLLTHYVERPEMMFEQYGASVRDAIASRAVA